MTAIYKKEIRSYFTSMIGCVFIAFALGIISLYFFALNLYGGYPYLGYALSSTTMLFLILIPVLTMKCMAEDRRQRTDQMLLTAPVSTWQIIVSKYMAMVTVFMIPVCVIALYPLILSSYGTISYGMAYASILGFALMGLMAIAVGLFISSITESQVIAAVLTFLILFVSYMAEAIAELIPSTAWVSFAAFAALVVVAAIVIYSLTASLFAGGLIGAAGILFLFVRYMLDSSAFEGGFWKAFECPLPDRAL